MAFDVVPIIVIRFAGAEVCGTLDEELEGGVVDSAVEDGKLVLIPCIVGENP